MRAYSFLKLVPLLLAACAASPSTVRPSCNPGTSAPVGSASSTPPGNAVLVQTAPYEIHEWGLVDASERGAVEVSAGPGLPSRPLRTRKPVLYVHLLDGVRSLPFSARVSLSNGSIVEHWPPGQVAGGLLEWPQVLARAENCGIGPDALRGLPEDVEAGGSSRRAAAVPACESPDGMCEIHELPTYVAQSAACLSVGNAAGPLLFYRGLANTLALPVRATRRADGIAVVTATGPLDGAPGQVLRLSSALTGPWPPGYIVASHAPIPSVGRNVELSVGTASVDAPAERRTLHQSLLQLGLSDDEAQAFVRAWGDELFGSQAPSRDLPPPHSRPQDVILMSLPPSCYDNISKLTFSPAPRAVRRAFLVRIDLGAVATG